MEKSCPPNKILNPLTKRCVLKTSSIGKKLILKSPIIVNLRRSFKTPIIKNYKGSIIKQLTLIKEYEKQQNNPYKVKAYSVVLNQLYNYKKPIKSYEDFIENIKVGQRIAKKVEQLINENKITYIEEKIIHDDKFKIQEELTRIYGIGIIKAKDLIKKGIKSIDDLKKNKHFLNDKQKIGLNYYSELEKRIPLNEYLSHKKILENDLKKIKLIYDFVGSYRRNSTTMGDIDILIMNNKNFDLNIYINDLKKLGYIKEILALGKVKFSGIVKLTDKDIARRLDILICPEREYYYSLLYFTGSAEFNIGMRNYIKQKYNLSLSEHGIKENDKIPIMKSEKDIFDYFNIKYVEPSKRKIFFNP